jgi:hypothetical protein
MTTTRTSATTTTSRPTFTHQRHHNENPTSTNSTTRTKIREQYTPRHHDLLVILPGYAGCVLCAITLHADDLVIDCGLGPEHRGCHDDQADAEHAAGRPC